MTSTYLSLYLTILVRSGEASEDWDGQDVSKRII